MTAIECVSREITRLQKEANKYVSKYGHVPSRHRNTYGSLVEDAKFFKESKDFLEGLSSGGEHEPGY